jgi:hypothetical protein
MNVAYAYRATDQFCVMVKFCPAIVTVAVRVPGVVLYPTRRITFALPVKEVLGNKLTQEALVLTFQVQLLAVVTGIKTTPPLVWKLVPKEPTVYEQLGVWPACVTEKERPAMVSEPVREVVFGLAATE